MNSRWSINITPAGRAARILLGDFGAVLGNVTGALGHCPLHAELGHVPTSLKGRTS